MNLPQKGVFLLLLLQSELSPPPPPHLAAAEQEICSAVFFFFAFLVIEVTDGASSLSGWWVITAEWGLLFVCSVRPVGRIKIRSESIRGSSGDAAELRHFLFGGCHSWSQLMSTSLSEETPLWLVSLGECKEAEFIHHFIQTLSNAEIQKLSY